MATISYEELAKREPEGRTSYFSLKNDRDTAKVIFPMHDIRDLQAQIVHQVEIGEKKRYVSCIHEYGQPKDDCPLCAAGKFTLTKFFIPVYNIKEQKVQVWERGKQFGDRMASICARNPELVTHGFEIERVGKAGDTKTTYEIYGDRDNDDPNRKVEDFDVPNPVGTIILNKNAEEMAFYLETGNFPSNGDDTRPSRTSSQSTNNYAQPQYEDRPVRRPVTDRDRF